MGILAVVEVLAFLRGPLRYGERLVGHDAALRALTRWRVWLYDCLTPRVPAALAGWRSGDLLTRAIDDVDTLQDLYLRTVLPVAIAVGAGVLGTVAVGLILPWAALGLGLPLAVALVVPAWLTWRRKGDDEIAALAGTLSAQVVDALEGAPELLAFGADEAALAAVARTARRTDALERRHAARATVAGLVIALCQAVALCTVLALGVVAVHDRTLGQVMVAVLPLAALATFETVPGVPLAVARSLAVRAAADRLFALEAVAIPVDDPPVPARLTSAVPDVTFARACLRYAETLPRALDGISLSLPAGHSLAVTGARAVPASPASSTALYSGSGRSNAARSPSTAPTCRSCAKRTCAAPARSRTNGPISSRGRCGPTSPWAGPTPATRPSTTPSGWPNSTASSPRCPPASTRRSATTVSHSRAASGGAWP